MTGPDRVRHNLGLGFGSIYVHSDGTVEYIKGLSTIFKLRVQDVTGFTVSKGKRWYDRNLQILGHETTLAILTDLGVNQVEDSEKIFRDNPMFGQSSARGGTASVADELKKLADLRASGVLTNAEFQDLKARLLNSRR
ncbi:SHOCT domain-containing protein [Mycobacterium sp. 5-140-3-2]|uniref:SHOCT domain-containing protein n=1 Tax=Mycobacterium TaxID=1763 RepID=UPI001935585D|nr:MULTISPECIES: SHOCT domain-containing protein [Mycobacterium]WRU80809.1 SHOCT domain-containing protein [Mycobacterium sp. 5-140-3-2]WSE43038.1 SHOCT domain-containing protein [Mycobacterium sp. 5-140-3-1]BCP06123.1 hypothetical protein MINTM019_35790 [Mycobacterium paraintracellulare]BCP11188.1 hypothetical protein MINTM020_32860 [Mycobacterium paraintracellulare]